MENWNEPELNNEGGEIDSIVEDVCRLFTEGVRADYEPYLIENELYLLNTDEYHGAFYRLFRISLTSVDRFSFFLNFVFNSEDRSFIVNVSDYMERWTVSWITRTGIEYVRVYLHEALYLAPLDRCKLIISVLSWVDPNPHHTHSNHPPLQSPEIVHEVLDYIDTGAVLLGDTSTPEYILNVHALMTGEWVTLLRDDATSMDTIRAVLSRIRLCRLLHHSLFVDMDGITTPQQVMLTQEAEKQAWMDAIIRDSVNENRNVELDYILDPNAPVPSQLTGDQIRLLMNKKQFLIQPRYDEMANLIKPSIIDSGFEGPPEMWYDYELHLSLTDQKDVDIDENPARSFSATKLMKQISKMSLPDEIISGYIIPHFLGPINKQAQTLFPYCVDLYLSTQHKEEDDDDDDDDDRGGKRQKIASSTTSTTLFVPV